MKQRLSSLFQLFVVLIMVSGTFLPALQVQATASAISVAEAIKNNAGNATVEGYIVGTVTSQSNFTLEGPFTVNTNLAIADSPDETDLSKCYLYNCQQVVCVMA